MSCEECDYGHKPTEEDGRQTRASPSDECLGPDQLYDLVVRKFPDAENILFFRRWSVKGKPFTDHALCGIKNTS